MTKMGFLRDFQGVIGRFLREFVAIAGFIIFFDYKVAEKSLGYLCTERDFWGVYRGILGDSRTQKPRAGVAVHCLSRRPQYKRTKSKPKWTTGVGFLWTWKFWVGKEYPTRQ